MAIKLPDLIIETVIREGLENIRRDTSIIDDIFADLLLDYNLKKYGEREINKLKRFVTKKEVAVTHSFNLVPANLPCYSIQLESDAEDKATAHLDDFEQDFIMEMTDPEDLAGLVVLTNVISSSYDSKSGTVFVDDAVDLSDVHANLLFVDASGTEHSILGGILNTPGSKQFQVAKASEVDISSPGEIKSSLNYEQYEKRGTRSQVRLVIGVHSKDALLTKYLYVMLKYILLSRKADLIKRCFSQSTFSGSDFTRNLEYAGDIVYTRFFTIQGIVEDNWLSDKVIPIDLIDIEVLVDKDKADSEDIKREDQTVKIGKHNQSE